jgi:quinol monooxygenase YgiN
MIIISAEIDFATEAQRDAAVAASKELQQSTRDDEPGCLAYCFGPDPCQDNRVQVYELWEDEASLAAHFEHPNYLNMRTKLGEFGITSAVSHKYRCDLREPVYDDTHTPRADFFTAG